MTVTMAPDNDVADPGTVTVATATSGASAPQVLADGHDAELDVLLVKHKIFRRAFDALDLLRVSLPFTGTYMSGRTARDLNSAIVACETVIDEIEMLDTELACVLASLLAEALLEASPLNRAANYTRAMAAQARSETLFTQLTEPSKWAQTRHASNLHMATPGSSVHTDVDFMDYYIHHVRTATR